MRNEAAALILAALALFGVGVWLTGYAIDRDIINHQGGSK